jgi:4-amino-4-deoxy-L-arabinose transferase-like glycosyltransferase
MTRRLTFWYALGAIAAGGLLLRLWVVLVQRPTADEPGGSAYLLAGDAYFYHWQGRALADGLGFIDPYRWQAIGEKVPSAAATPLYSVFLGAVSWFGAQGVTAHRVASSVLGVTGVVLLALVARKIAGDRAGLLAAGIAALYPMLWINDGMLLSEVVVIPTLALVLLLGYRFWEQATLLRAGLMGASIGIAALGAPEVLILFVLLAVPLVLRMDDKGWKVRARTLGVIVLAGLVVLAPWLAFTTTAFDRPTFMTSSQGSVLSAGTCDEVYYGTYIGYTAACFDGPYPSIDLDEAERDTYPRDDALEYMGDHLERVPLVVAARIGRIWGVFKPGQTTALDWSLEGRGRAASWIGLFSFYLLAPLAIGGIVVLARRKVPISPLVALAINATIAAATTAGVPRYRVPAEPAIVVGAAVALDAIWRHFAPAKRSAEAEPVSEPAPATPVPDYAP